MQIRCRNSFKSFFTSGFVRYDQKLKWDRGQDIFLFTNNQLNLVSTVVHDFNGHEVNGKHGFNGKKCYDGGFYVVNNGKIDV